MGERFLILDCYVDEPACLGVPPFVAPYPRYVYGALLHAGVAPASIDYLTIDALRSTEYRLDDRYGAAFIIGGAVVPGKYLGHRIGTTAEIVRVIEGNPRQEFAAGGMIAPLIARDCGPNCVSVLCDIELYAHTRAHGEPSDGRRTAAQIARWSVDGAALVRLHPDHPRLICEIETYRGCPRLSHCSFCPEGATHRLEFRDEEDILAEIDALIAAGVSRFRIGRQADIFQYKTPFEDFRNGFPRPSIDSVRGLFGGLRERRDSGAIRVLNIDNGNPGTIANFPEESSAILSAIADAVTPGDTIALGVESLDPTVIKRNNLKVNAKELLDVVRLINDIGGRRVEGLPVLLPGINLIHGLPGEGMDTFRMNFEGLAAIAGAGLMVKRINIRKLLPYPGTAAGEAFREPPAKLRNRYEYYKKRIRDEIDRVMLARVYPAGTILREALVEERRHAYSLAKQIASYSITATIPVALPLKSFVDVMVVGHRERSVAALPFPLGINSLPAKALELISGVGKKSASELILRRPFAGPGDVRAAAPSIPDALIEGMVFD
ncbi:MAG TPA: radical SAM protein [Spirochaetota bacterium]|nr:radical SAM protein [Spirochaetota bacterium]